MHNKKLKQLMDQLYQIINDNPNVNHFTQIKVEPRLLSDNTFSVSFAFEFTEPGYDAKKESWDEYTKRPKQLNRDGVIDINVPDL